MATSDPIAAAEQLAGQTYAGAQDRTAAGKKALLDQLSTQGTYTNQLNQASTAAAAPSPAPAHPGDSAAPQLGAMSSAGAQQVQMANQAALGAAAALAAHQQANQQAQAGTYFDQVAAAIPLEQSRSQSQAAQIMQQLIDEREQRANAVKLQQLQMQETQARIAAAAADRQAASANGGLSAAQALGVSDDYKKNAIEIALPPKYDEVDDNGNLIGLGKRGQAISDVVNGGLTPEQAAAKNGIHTKEYIDEIAQQSQRYYDSLEQQGYYRIHGGTKPQVYSPTAPAGWDLSNPSGMLGSLNASAGNLLSR